MKLKDYIKKVLEESEPGEILFNLCVSPSDGGIIVVAYVDAPNVSRIIFTVVKE